MRVLTWNLFHGRANLKGPGPFRLGSLLPEFRAALEGWEWDVALLQEVPPWWPPELPGTDHRTALTSRNLGLCLRRPIADRWPDLIRSNGGGANAILVRRGQILEHRRHRLRWWPERRVVHAVRLGSGVWVANLHAQVHSEARAQSDVAEAVEVVRAWAAGAPFVVGGDLNVREPRRAGLVSLGGHGVDHVLACGLVPGGVELLDRGALSDHAPVLVEGTVVAGRQHGT